MIRELLAVAAVLALGCSTGQDAANTGNNINQQTSNANSKFSTTNTITVTAPAIPEGQLPNSGTAPGTKSFFDGPQIVGKDIEPGTYRTRAGTQKCTWTRRSGFTGDAGEITAAANPQGPAIVTIKASDKGFESTSCGMWTSDLSAITSSPTGPFGDGEYQVGADVARGTWKAQNPVHCYWARVSGFSGEPADIIANSTDSGIVTIQKTDKGFVTSGCGSWNRSE
jgi:hypothetical protein